MNKLYIGSLIIFVIIISNLNAQSTIDHSNNDIQDDSQISSTNNVLLDTLVYEVYGMDCPGCHSALEKQINKIGSVEYSIADWVEQEVMIVVKKDSIIKDEEIYEKIKKANFTPGDQIIR